MWTSCDIRNLDLNEALDEIARGSQMVHNSWIAGIQVPGSAQKWAVADLDGLLRLVLWALLPVMAAGAYYGYHHPFLPNWGGMWSIVSVVGALGCVCRDNIKSAFTSRIRERLNQAKEAVAKEDMIANLFLLAWAVMFSLTPFAMITRPWVLWGNTDNNLWLSVVERLRQAMILLETMPCASKTEWSERHAFEEYLKGVEGKLDEMKAQVDRTIVFPREIMSTAAWMGGVLTLFGLGARILEVLLRQ
ncbi:MAG: hypothetical protein RL326_2048 [Pseudomonadota bacterium]|jgi:hypothetical protein